MVVLAGSRGVPGPPRIAHSRHQHVPPAAQQASSSSSWSLVQQSPPCRLTHLLLALCSGSTPELEVNVQSVPLFSWRFPVWAIVADVGVSLQVEARIVVTFHKWSY